MYEHTRRDRINNKVIQDKIGVTFMVDKIGEATAEMVQICEKNMCICLSKKVREIDYSGYYER